VNPFRLGEWWVEPTLNSIERREDPLRAPGTAGVAVRLEPKMMDVLVALSRRPGEVVSKAELETAVWPGVFISDSVLTRAVAGLRRAFGDDAQEPRFIQTIAKRGYRLLLEPEGAPAAARREAPDPAAPGASARRIAAVGQWVRGEAFFGREDLVHEVLRGPRNGLWLLGSRASGKTSTLRHLDWLVSEGGIAGFVPLFWDLQGGDGPAALDLAFSEALTDAQPRLEPFLESSPRVEDGDCLAAIQTLRRAVRRSGSTLLLLVDEAEELLAVAEHHPAWIRRLRRVLQSQEGMRTVLASGPRLWRLGEPEAETSPFLHGFAPPHVLGGIESDAADRLLRRNLGHILPGHDITRLSAECAGHPFILQLACERVREVFEVSGDLTAAVDRIDQDPSLHALFAVDHSLFGDTPPIPGPFWSRWLDRR
jgi:DNA-binding winged helix-turn-helix (wHTH) protein